jgi:hypothetical protein
MSTISDGQPHTGPAPAHGGALVRASFDPAEGSATREDLWRVALTAYLTGRTADCATLLRRAYHELVGHDDRAAAVRCAFWLAFVLINDGQWAVAGGWLTRARRLLDGVPPDRVEHGYVLLPEAMREAAAGHFGQVWRLASEAARYGDRSGDADLVALARSVQGRASIRLGDIAGGLGMLDEAMLTVTTEDVSPIVATTVYCGLIEACREIYDLRRAREWTGELTGWYDLHPDVGLNRGRCRVYRAEVLFECGDWTAAVAEAERALARSNPDPDHQVIGAAHYLCGEVHRLRGDREAAEEAYGLASAHGHEPQPGLALLRLSTGDLDTARATIRRAVAESSDRPGQPTLLAAYVEIAVAAGDLPAAGVAASGLEGIAVQIGTPRLEAMSAHAAGAILLANRDPRAALRPLRRACAIWQSLGVPYGLARRRTLFGLACRELGDEDTATLELHAARSIDQRLGVASGPPATVPTGGAEARGHPHGARVGRPPVGRDRRDQPGHRRAARPERDDHRPSYQQRPGQAGPTISVRGHGLRVPTSPGLIGVRCDPIDCPAVRPEPRTCTRLGWPALDWSHDGRPPKAQLCTSTAAYRSTVSRERAWSGSGAWTSRAVPSQAAPSSDSSGPYATSPSPPDGRARSASGPVPRPSTRYRLPPVRPPGNSHMVRPSVLRHRRSNTSRYTPAW